jgi:regulator of sigma E protease
VLLTILAFLLVLGVVIFVHELGHFLAAKAVGIGVPRFSIGFGPATPLRYTWRGTEYVVAWFPLGGYVKMASREEQEAMADLEGGRTEPEYPPEQLFESKSLFARVIVISAGVVMNLLFAWAAYAGLAGALGRAEDPTTRIAVDTMLLPERAAALAAVPRGAQIVRVNGDTARSWNVVLDAVLDATTPRLRLDFAAGVDPVILDVPGTHTEDRLALLGAVKPLYPPVIGAMSPGMPAAQSGLESGDSIIGLNGEPVEAFNDLTAVVEGSIGDTVFLTVLRRGEELTIGVVPVERTVPDPVTGEESQRGRIGVDPLVQFIRTDYGFFGAIGAGAARVWRDLDLIAFTLKGIVTGRVSRRELGGPILIGQLAGQVARVGLAPLLAFMALISVNLAVFNLLPIPVLDGGHLVFLFAEGILGRPLPLEWRMRLIQVGLVLILALMVFVFRNDILRLVGA